MNITTTAAGVLIAATLSAIPIVPVNMQFQMAYSTRYIAPHTITTATGTISIGSQFPDSGDGNSYVAVFTDYRGNIVEVPITRERYISMGQKDGEKNNPKNAEYISVFQALLAQPASAAIAFDNFANETAAAANSKTISYTMGSGANGIMFITAQMNNATDDTTSATFNAKAGSLVKFHNNSAVGDSSVVWCVLAPDSGTHNAVLNASAADIRRMQVTSYTGASQTNCTDSTPTTYDGTATSLTTTDTSTTDNAWGFAMGDINGVATAGSNTVKRGQTAGDYIVSDTGVAQTPAGNFSMTWTFSNTQYGMISFAFPPASAAATTIIQPPQLIWFD